MSDPVSWCLFVHSRLLLCGFLLLMGCCSFVKSVDGRNTQRSSVSGPQERTLNVLWAKSLRRCAVAHYALVFQANMTTKGTRFPAWFQSEGKLGFISPIYWFYVRIIETGLILFRKNYVRTTANWKLQLQVTHTICWGDADSIYKFAE